MRNRRFRFPVLSRLSWAWLGSLTVILLIAGVTVVVSDHGAPQRIALPLQQLERIAPPGAAQGRLTDAATGVTLAAAPTLRDGAAPNVVNIQPSAEGAQTTDGLLYTNDNDVFAEYADDDPNYSADDVIITIDGRRQGVTPPANATALRPIAPTAIASPNAALLKSTPLGRVPRIAADGRKAIEFYARPFNGKRSQPKIALIVAGLGLDPALTERAIDQLPAEVSLSFAPYAKDLEFWTEKARKAGHEVLIELPMEGHGANQEALGAAALLSTRTPEENLQRLDWLLSRFGGYFAATNYLGSKFSGDAAAMTPVLARLRESGVGYIDDTGAAGPAAQRAGVTMTMVSRMIPPALDEGARGSVRRALMALEEVAEHDGVALGKAYAYATTISEITAWAEELNAKGMAAAPASAVLRAHNATR